MLCSQSSPAQEDAMNPLDDTLNAGATLPRPERGAGPATDQPNGDDLESQMTLRLPGMGTMVFNRYRLQRVLGRGGMGVVWLAVDTKLERAVALKFLPGIVGADPAALQELTEETRRGLELAHPNIVRIYDLVNDEETAAISMEFVDGRNLSEMRLTRPHGVFSVEDISPWLGHLCSALDYAHLHKRIVHRDLKPANLMLDVEGTLKITDFGIARSINDAVSRLSRAAQASTSGTLPYMSPQQVMGDQPRPTDDVYSVGATIYELLTGKPPFHSGDIGLQITARTAPSIGQRREELCISATDAIPQEWEDAVAACLDKDPSQRPRTAGELARRLGLSMSVTEPAAPVTSTTVASPKPVEPADRAKATTVTTQPAEVASQAPAAKKKAPILAIVLGMLAVLMMMAALGSGALWWWFHRAGSWAVQTEPAGAQVTVDGHTFVAPATIPNLKPGTYTASILLEGYEPRNVEFDVPPGQQADFGVVTLERSAGQLLLSSDPDGVGYEVDLAGGGNGKPVSGKTPDTLRLPIGKYSVTMKHGGESKTADIVIARNDTARQAFTFEKPAPPPPSIASNALPSALPPVNAGSAPPLPLSTLPIGGSGPADPPPAPSSSTLSSDRIVTMPPVGQPSSAASPSASSRASFLTGGAIGGPAPVPPPSPSAPPVIPPALPGGPPVADSPGAVPAVPGTPGPPANGESVTLPPQPVVQPPAAGYWTLNEILANSEYGNYSEPGRRYLVYKAQQALEEGADGVPGKGTYKAIQKFQTESSLQPTGQLDSQTLAALGLSGQPDKADWGRSRSSGDRTPESEKTAARKFIERKLLGGRDLKNIFRR
jgi:hypothetical protein